VGSSPSSGRLVSQWAGRYGHGRSFGITNSAATHRGLAAENADIDVGNPAFVHAYTGRVKPFAA
jgi:hypothetical protein